MNYHLETESIGIVSFTEERERHIVEKNFSPERDDAYPPGELARAGACYADFAAGQMEGISQDEPHAFWPWSAESWNPGGSPVRTLEKAGALLAAEYDARYREIMGLNK